MIRASLRGTCVTRGPGAIEKHDRDKHAAENGHEGSAEFKPSVLDAIPRESKCLQSVSPIGEGSMTNMAKSRRSQIIVSCEVIAS